MNLKITSESEKGIKSAISTIVDKLLDELKASAPDADWKGLSDFTRSNRPRDLYLQKFKIKLTYIYDNSMGRIKVNEVEIDEKMFIMLSLKYGVTS